jgi:hypothetical protein
MCRQISLNSPILDFIKILSAAIWLLRVTDGRTDMATLIGTFLQVSVNDAPKMADLQGKKNFISSGM